MSTKRGPIVDNIELTSVPSRKRVDFGLHSNGHDFGAIFNSYVEHVNLLIILFAFIHLHIFIFQTWKQFIYDRSVFKV